jgi:transposase
MAVDENGMPVGCIVTAGTVADCTKAEELLEGMNADALFADIAYDTDAILEYVESKDIKVVIPPKKNRVVQREYDKELYKKRHRVENAILKLKGWRGVATRYAKHSSSFLSIVIIRCIFLWLNT